LCILSGARFRSNGLCRLDSGNVGTLNPDSGISIGASNTVLELDAYDGFLPSLDIFFGARTRDWSPDEEVLNDLDDVDDVV
jgi:hypothetical protein